MNLEQKCTADQIADGIICEIREDQKLDLGKIRTLIRVRNSGEAETMNLALGGQIKVEYEVALATIHTLHSHSDIRKLIDAIVSVL